MLCSSLARTRYVEPDAFGWVDGEAAVSVMVGTGGTAEALVVGGGEPRSDGVLLVDRRVGRSSGCWLDTRFPLPLGVGSSEGL